LGEAERARAIFDLSINRPNLDMPEQSWKAFIDFEIELGEIENVRVLYQRLLEKTQHVKVWLSAAKFEVVSANENDRARRMYQKAYSFFKDT
jgi:crooked neck